MQRTHATIVAAVRTGATIEEAAKRAGINVHTVRRWLSTGRKQPDGPYGELAADVDRLRDGPHCPRDHARAFIVALATFMRSGDDADGKRLSAVAGRIPHSDLLQVAAEVGTHFLAATYRQLAESAGSDDAPAAIEAMFLYVDEVRPA
jgi:hypothetical protein